MVNIEALVKDGEKLFRKLDQEQSLTVDGAFWTNIREPEPPRLKLLIKQLPILGPTKLYATIQRLLRKLPVTSFTLEDVSLVDDEDPDVRSLRSVAGNSPLLSMIFPNLPNTGGGHGLRLSLGTKGKSKAELVLNSTAAGTRSVNHGDRALVTTCCRSRSETSTCRTFKAARGRISPTHQGRETLHPAGRARSGPRSRISFQCRRCH